MTSRRDLLKSAAAASAGLALTHLGVDEATAAPSHESRVTSHDSMAGVPFERRDTVRIAIVGTGLRGRSMLNEWLGVENVRITALCDLVPEKVEQARQMMKQGRTRLRAGDVHRGRARLREPRAAAMTSTSCTPPRRGNGTCRSAWRR